ncbi:MAG: hypothetical protein SGPRY_000168 [Prymnesium sp.]
MSLSFRMKGGRSSVSGIKATVFGCTGFLGSYVVNRLGRVGSTVVAAYRGDEIYARKLKPMGDLGQINLTPCSIRSVSEIERAVGESEPILPCLIKPTPPYLIKTILPLLRWSFEDVNASFPAALGEICKAQGVSQLVHISALGASLDSPSKWSASKAEGEARLKASFPSATILRPATFFGDADRFLNRLAKLSQTLPFVPLIEADKTRQQPVYADDVAAAIIHAITTPSMAGSTVELAGPKVYTNQQLVDYVLRIIDEPSNGFNVPASVGMILARMTEKLPDAWLTRDQLLRESVDIIRADGLTGFEEMGITPTAIEDVAERYLIRFRKSSIMLDRENSKIIGQQSI